MLPCNGAPPPASHLSGGHYQPAGSFFELKATWMNIDDMGDNTRLPEQRRPAYWPGCACGPVPRCGLMRPDDAPLQARLRRSSLRVTNTIHRIYFAGIAAG